MICNDEPPDAVIIDTQKRIPTLHSDIDDSLKAFEDFILNERNDGEDQDILAPYDNIMPSEKRLEKAFAGTKERGEAALITYITAGYPTSQDTPYILLAMQEAGVDIIELGVPYDDPIADGPTLQNSHRVSIENGTEGVTATLDMLSIARKKGLTVAVILMGYYDGFEQHPGGIDAMCSEARAHKADGFLAVGVPEGKDELDFNTSCFRNGLSSILLVLPDTSEERIEHLVAMSSSFIYVVSSKGPTGARDALPPDLNDIVGRVRVKTNIPLAVGFGISKPEMVHAVSHISDGAIVGSSITTCLNDANANTIVERANTIRDYVAHLKVGTKQSVDPCPTNQARSLCKIPSRLLEEIEREMQNTTEIPEAMISRQLSQRSFARSSMLKQSLRRSSIMNLRFT